jgi:SAM-dependent methyltransferase
MRAEAYAEMAALEERHWWFRGRRAVIAALLARAGVRPGVRMLDAGCGTGGNLRAFGGLGPSEGIDDSAEAVAVCHARGLTQVVRGTLDALPYEDGAFGLILATDVLEHLDDDVGALRELRRVAAPGAALIVTVPAHPWLWSAHDEAVHHRRRYRRAELLGRARVAAWRPEVVTGFNTLLLPPIALARLARRGRDGTDHDATPPALDRVLVQPMRLEGKLVARGVDLPPGVSLGLALRAA